MVYHTNGAVISSPDTIRNDGVLLYLTLFIMQSSRNLVPRAGVRHDKNMNRRLV